MLKKILVTVKADLRDREYTPVYLGIWALPSRSVLNLDRNDGDVIPYHYDDRSVLERDYEHAAYLHSRLLPELAIVLNRGHGTQISTRAWQTYVGRWLENFIQVFLDRFRSIYLTKQMFDIDFVIASTATSVPVKTEFEYQVKVSQDDTYNLDLYSGIIRSLDLAWTPVSVATEQLAKRERSKIRARIKNLMQRAFDVIGSNAAVFFDTTYFKPLDVVHLVITSKLRFKPLFFFPNPVRDTGDSSLETDNEFRAAVAAHLKFGLEKNYTADFGPNFVEALCDAIGKHLPMCFLEDFEAIHGVVKSMKSPEKAVYTCNLLYSNDAFRLFCARIQAEGRNLVIGQHGGHYGLFKWSPWEKYELDISDLYLSFGWSRPEAEIKGISHPLLAVKAKVVDRKTNGKVLLLTNCFSRYFYLNWSSPVPGSSVRDYIEARSLFVRSLSDESRSRLVVRLYPSDDVWRDKDRLLSEFPSLEFDRYNKPFRATLFEADLVVVDNNHTTYLESLNLGKPTIVFWNEENWPLSDIAKPMFAELKKNNIFHTSPESAAAFISNLHGQGEESISQWWRSYEVQLAVQEFLSSFGRNNQLWVNDYVDTLGSLKQRSSDAPHTGF